MNKVIISFTTMFLGSLTFFSQAADRDILWDIVHNKCQPSYDKQGTYGSCSLVNENEGYVLMKDRNGKYQYLLMPLNKVSGIEDKQLVSGNVPDYFRMAWDGRALVTEKTGQRIKENDVSLTVNSINARSQDQLHIHISCLAKPVREALDRFKSEKLGDNWSTFPEKLMGYEYSVKKLSSEAFENRNGDNIFKTVSDKVAQDGNEMQYATIAVVNQDKNNFLLLLAQGSKSNPVGAEELQDHDCGLPD